MSIFNTNDDDITLSDDVDYFAELVGDDKKFKDPKALAKGKAEADRYIELLKKQLADANAELNTRTSLDSFLTQMKDKPQGQAPVQPSPVPPASDIGALDESKLEERLMQILAKREAAKMSETNTERVTRVLSEQLGSNQSTFIKQKSAELQMPVAELEAFAIKSPAAFFRLVGISEERPNNGNPVVPRSGVNSSSVPSTGGVKNKAYFEKLKQTDPKTYRDPKTTGEMMRAMADCRARGIAWE